jgi:hypothetical protein
MRNRRPWQGVLKDFLLARSRENLRRPLDMRHSARPTFSGKIPRRAAEQSAVRRRFCPN